MKGYEQKVVNESNWLTDGNGQFVKVIFLPEGQSWQEVTEEARLQWIAEHTPEEPDGEQ